MYILPMNLKYKVWKKWQLAFSGQIKWSKRRQIPINKGIVSAFSLSNKLHEKYTYKYYLHYIKIYAHLSISRCVKIKEKENE